MFSHGKMIHEDGRIGLVVIDANQNTEETRDELDKRQCNHCDADCCKRYGRCDKGDSP